MDINHLLDAIMKKYQLVCQRDCKAGLQEKTQKTG